MHGRVKVKERTEIELEKKKKYIEKAVRFKIGQELCLRTKTNNDLNIDLMRISWDLLVTNPDVYTLWNLRKEHILIMKERIYEQIDVLKNQTGSTSNLMQVDTEIDENIVDQNDENFEDQNDENKEILTEEVLIGKFQRLCEDELELTEFALLKNAKSYSAWQHRLWVLGLIPRPNFKREFQLNEAYLQKDGRNLHCWNYRNNLCRLSKRAIPEEIKFSLDRIKENLGEFSYSTLYYRSLVLTKAAELKISDFSKNWLEEYKLIESAIYTEPNDQALWFYLRWLLLIDFGHCLALRDKWIANDLKKIIFNKESGLLIFHFTKVVKQFPYTKISLANSVDLVQENFQTVLHKPSPLWFTHLKNVSQVNEIVLESGKKFKLENLQNYELYINEEICSKSSDIKMQIPNEQLESLISLKQLEPNNKWLNLILSYFENNDQLKILDHLTKLDPLRTNYYNDQKSKINLEKAVSSSDRDHNSLDLSKQKLTVLYTTDSLAHYNVINLSGNQIRCLTTNLNSLISVKHLIIDDNQIDKIHRNFTLPNLESLSLRKNNLNKNSGLNYLVNCPNLKKVDLSGNQVSADVLEELIKKGIQIIQDK